MSPRDLVAAAEQHQKRLKAYQKLATDVSRLDKEAQLIEPWRHFSNSLEILLESYPDSEDLKEVDQLVAKELRRSGRKVLPEFDSWEKTLINAERSTKAGRPRGIDLGDSWQNADLSEFRASDPEKKLEAPPVSIELLQKPLPSLSHNDSLPEDAEQEKLFPYAVDAFDTPDKEETEAPEIGGIPIQLPSFELLNEPEATHEDPAALAKEVQLPA